MELGGPPPINLAEDQGAGLIVMGSHAAVTASPSGHLGMLLLFRGSGLLDMVLAAGQSEGHERPGRHG